MPATEAFPPLSPSSHDRSTGLSSISTVNVADNATRSRRRSSGLGGEIRAGDTSAPALATLDMIPQSPRSIKVRRERESVIYIYMKRRYPLPEELG